MSVVRCFFNPLFRDRISYEIHSCVCYNRYLTVWFIVFTVLEYSTLGTVAFSTGGGTIRSGNQENRETAREFISSHRQRSRHTGYW